ncbi:Rieske 2Fe-2S domain-containing protein [Streptomyces sp. NPDC001315]|uniref:Rieske 2Fe-2S domain-containing protein n=1 Tax=Streptomyces sp. NPDC001315 TaxID=3364562 RepID=UPI0036B3F1C8
MNERLSLVGAGTPAGELFRRQWQPIATEADLAGNPVKRVRILGEDLVLYRATSGELGLVRERCPHRGASLGYGFPEENGLRCPYHGWLFSARGECLEQPNQVPDSPQLKSRAQITGYPVQVLGGLVFAYLGPGPAPALPRLDLFTREEGPARFRDIGYAVIPCNWLQIMENSFDPTHVEWLHGHLFNYHLEREGKEPTVLGGHHIKIGFDLVDYGIIKRRLREGQTEDDEDWKVGHPVYFPNILKVGGYGLSSFQIRVPVDDTHTLHFWYCWYDVPEEYGPLVDDVRHLPDAYEVTLQNEDGSFLMDTIDSQDAMVWVTQGPLTTRDDEHLSSSDQGIALYRNLLRSQLEIVENGGTPMNVTAAEDAKDVIELPQEQKELGIGGGGGNPVASFLRTQALYSPRLSGLAQRIDSALWKAG